MSCKGKKKSSKYAKYSQKSWGSQIFSSISNRDMFTISPGPGPSDRFSKLTLTTLQTYKLTRGLTYSIEGMTGYGEGIFIKKNSKDFYINIQRILI